MTFHATESLGDNLQEELDPIFPNKKNIISLSSAEFALSMLSVIWDYMLLLTLVLLNILRCHAHF